MKGREGMKLLLPCLLFFSAGCASLPTRPADLPSLAGQPGVYYLAGVPPVRQDAYQCGPAALESVLRYWGADADADGIAKALSSNGKRGVLNIALAQHVSQRGFWTQMQSSDLDQLKEWLRRGVPPVVMLHVGPLGLPLHHFAVVTGFNENQRLVYLNAGRASTESIGAAQFDARWSRSGRWALVICPPDKVSWPLTARQSAEMALLHEKRGDLDSARQWYEAAAAKEPDNPAVLFNLANVRLRQGKLEEAAALYEKLARNHPDWPGLQNNRAWARLSSGDGRGAVALLRASFRRGLAPDYDSLDTLGAAYCRLKQCRRAQACFEAAALRVPARRTEAAQAIAGHLRECRAAQAGK